jgi:hypothetical protein
VSSPVYAKQLHKKGGAILAYKVVEERKLDKIAEGLERLLEDLD